MTICCFSRLKAYRKNKNVKTRFKASFTDNFKTDLKAYKSLTCFELKFYLKYIF